MEFVHRQSFIDFFHERRHRHDDADLLFKMSAFDKQTVREVTIEMLAPILTICIVYSSPCLVC